MLLNLLLIVVLIVVGLLSLPASSSGPSTVLCSPHARFTVVSPRIVRIEYIDDVSQDAFEDRSSTAFAHRRSMPMSDVRVENGTSEWCNISVQVPPYLKVSFRKVATSSHATDSSGNRGGAYFQAHELSITSENRKPERAGFTWNVGAKASGNLLGTIGLTNVTIAGANTSGVDLSGCCSNPSYPSVFDPKYPLKYGILSRDGWSLVDDSFTELIDDGTGDFDNGWISEMGRAPDSTDWLFFGCGHEYALCLEEFVQVSGKISAPTKNALGLWWSRHWGDPFDHNPFGPMTEEAIMNDVVNGYLKRNLPLDVVVLDMEWHSQTQYPDCETFIGIKGWGGYTWNKTLFPDPGDFIAKVHSHDIHVALNFHPDGTIDACQEPYTKLAEALGVDPATKQGLPDLDVSQKNETYCNAHFTTCIEPLHNDIAWTDTAMSTTWSNYLYVRFPALRKNKRTINFSRYTGIGDQRKPIGFSGDTLRRFDTLQYEVYMTPRAANVGFGWWSHDIGGFRTHAGYINHTNHTETPQLFLRWLQFATFAPIFRQHCRFCDQRIWTFGDEWYGMMKETLLERHRLFPYINTHAHLETYSKGRSLLAPLYWSSSEAASMDEAYAPMYSNTEYLFGKHFIVAPITEPLEVATAKRLWLPPGLWVNWRKPSQVFHGPKELVLENLKLSDSPVFVNSSAIIPIQTDVESSNIPHQAFPIIDPAVWVMFPSSGATIASGELFEDDGKTMDYRKKDNCGIHTTITATITRQESNEQDLPVGSKVFGHVESTIGNGLSSATKKTLPTHRRHWVKMLGIEKHAKHVQCAGEMLAEIANIGTNSNATGYWIDKGESSLWLYCGYQPLSDSGGFDISVEF